MYLVAIAVVYVDMHVIVFPHITALAMIVVVNDLVRFG